MTKILRYALVSSLKNKISYRKDCEESEQILIIQLNILNALSVLHNSHDMAKDQMLFLIIQLVIYQYFTVLCVDEFLMFSHFYVL